MAKTSSKLRSFNKRLIGITMPINRKRAKWGRNWLCICGSKLKYKNCCLPEIDSLKQVDNNARVTQVPSDIQTMIEQYKKAQEEKEKMAKAKSKADGEQSNG